MRRVAREGCSVAMSALIGNERAKKALLGAISAGRMPQAIILEGDDGSGKETFARLIAAAACCTSGDGRPCGKCRSCRRILDSLTPDVAIIEREDGKQAITINIVREMNENVNNGPCELSMLFFVIREADRMNLQAQNAWLLTLENPPDDVGFIILCENSRNLLETIRSRAMTFRMERFEPEFIVKCIKDDSERFGRFDNGKMLYESALASGGSIGKTLELMTDASRIHDLRRMAFDTVSAMLDIRINKTQKIRTAMKLPDGKEDRESLSELFSLISEAITDLVVLKEDEGATLAFFSSDMRDEAIRLADASGTGTLISLRRECMNAIDALKMNASVKVTKINTSLKLGLL